MITYKAFKKIYIGESDISSLTLRSCGNVASLDFGIDAAYFAYAVFGEAEIGEHYTLVFEGKGWLKIYDDSERSYYVVGDSVGYPYVTVYRAGEMGCIIHWHD